ERLLPGAADPEVALPRFAHFDHPLFHGAGPHHEAEDLPAALGRQSLRSGKDLEVGDGGLPVGRGHNLVARQAPPGFRTRHATSSWGSRGRGPPARDRTSFIGTLRRRGAGEAGARPAGGPCRSERFPTVIIPSPDAPA